ncbi:MAG: dienelactone hydrolase family protein [Sandaracinaceae bacterium]|nr:dienelactone hydrolase family protein [Sandaracinaceae bacterium]
MTTRELTLALREDDAGSPRFTAALAGERGPGIVVIHEWWGLNDELRAQCARFAAEGFVALAPDLYDRPATTDPAEALARASALRTEDATERVARCVRELRGRGAPKVGVTGFCLGGAMAFAAAASVEGLSAAVPFYGNARADYMVAERMRCPIQAHFAEGDPFARAEPAVGLARDVRAAGGRMDLFFYEAKHAFMRESDPDAYHEPSATLAWERAIAFLHAELG